VAIIVGQGLRQCLHHIGLHPLGFDDDFPEVVVGHDDVDLAANQLDFIIFVLVAQINFDDMFGLGNEGIFCKTRNHHQRRKRKHFDDFFVGRMGLEFSEIGTQLIQKCAIGLTQIRRQPLPFREKILIEYFFKLKSCFDLS
jgi:hypothetical protein